ncbi:MAG: hypothetical protein IKG79_03350, partial [Neisseriaceae bacterium]|nr:hypothetical protein [Neisseriaceae bacterium]
MKRLALWCAMAVVSAAAMGEDTPNQAPAPDETVSDSLNNEQHSSGSLKIKSSTKQANLSQSNNQPRQRRPLKDNYQLNITVTGAETLDN